MSDNTNEEMTVERQADVAKVRLAIRTWYGIPSMLRSDSAFRRATPGMVDDARKRRLRRAFNSVLAARGLIDPAIGEISDAANGRALDLAASRPWWWRTLECLGLLGCGQSRSTGVG
jgi:hypothetical protein